MPTEMFEPYHIISKKFPLGTIAGSLGQRKNSRRKPGINEDAALVAYNDRFTLAILIDGHYSRDTTELMIETLQQQLKENKTIWHFSGLEPDNANLNPKIYSMSISQRFFDVCKMYLKKVVNEIRRRMYQGEASFTITLYDATKHELHYYQVGDLLYFMTNPNRHWGPAFQIGSRQFYEWVNSNGIMGYHHGTLQCRAGSRLILATDGLLDKPTFSMEEIEELFALKPFSAENFVKLALEQNSLEDDDNITVMCLTVPNNEIPH